MKKIIFFGGKGGVGKTTCSAAFATACALKNNKVLLVSTDPAHSTSDIFERPIGDKIVKIDDNLDALEINSQNESQKYMNRVQENLKTIVSPIIVKEIKKQIDSAAISPGTEEAALFDKMIEIINEESKSYDYIIFDTAPTGHTVRLLTLPTLLGAWVDSLLRKRKKALSIRQMADNNGKKNKKEIEEDPVVEILTKRANNIEKVKKIMLDENKLNFTFVMNAEKLPIEETKKAIAILEKYKIPVNNIIVNRILPEDLSDDFWKQKKELESQYMNEIYETFKNKEIVKIPMLSTDMRAANISEVAEHFVKIVE